MGGKGKGEGPPQLPSPARIRQERDGPYHYTKQHGSSDDPPDFLTLVGSPAPAAKGQEKTQGRDKVE